MPLSSSHPSTKDVLKRISDCQLLLNEIHDTLGYTQAYGLPVPPSTIQTWRIITDRLDCISYRWEIALQKKKRHPLNIVVSLECKGTIITLKKILKRARDYQICVRDGGDNGKKTAAERWSRLQGFGERHMDWSKAPDVEAYRTLCALQRYTEGRGWIPKNDFGVTWSDSELRERKEISEKHIRDVTNRIHSQETWGSIHGWGYMESRERKTIKHV